MGIDDQRIVHRHLEERDIRYLRAAFAMGDGRHAFGERGQHRGGAAERVAFQRFAARQHEHDDGAGEVFAQNDGRDNGNPSEQIGTEFAFQQFAQQFVKHGQPADHEDGQQRDSVGFRRGVKPETQQQMRGDADERKCGDEGGLTLPKSAGGIPRAFRRW